MAEKKYIKVKPVENHRRVILFERDPLHPEVEGVHEAFINANANKTFEVGETPRVLTLIANNKLKKV